MPHGPQKLILINAGRYDFAEVQLSGSLQMVGPNNTGKTTLINTLQFLYLDDRRHMYFGNYTPEQTRDYYFANQYSYVLFQCLGARGQFVFGWRGQSKAAGGEPERFYYEGPFDAADFLDVKGQVREPKAATARLASRQFSLMKTAHEQRELLLLATKGEPRGLGLVALRDNDRYPQFRETLKNLLSLSTITQDQMRDRLLMLAGLSTERYALDVRELFGEDYDKIRERKRKLNRFKEHQNKVEAFVDACAQREALRGEMIFRWSDLQPKRQTFEQAHEAKIEKLKRDEERAKGRMQALAHEIFNLTKDKEALSEAKGGLKSRLDEATEKEKQFKDFVEGIARTALKNTTDQIHKVRRQLSDADAQTREKVETRLKLYQEVVARKRQTIAHFDRALITILRRSMTDEELSPLARLFNFDLLEAPVGDDGIRLKQPDDFVATLRGLRERIQEDCYRDRRAEIPLPAILRRLAELENPDAIREGLTDDEETLQRCEAILQAIDAREKLSAELRKKEKEEAELSRQIFEWEDLQRIKTGLPQLREELTRTDNLLSTVTVKIENLTRDREATQKAESTAANQQLNEENQFNAAMGRFNECIFLNSPRNP